MRNQNVSTHTKKILQIVDFSTFLAVLLLWLMLLDLIVLFIAPLSVGVVFTVPYYAGCNAIICFFPSQSPLSE